MLQVSCTDRLREIKKWAEDQGLLGKLEAKLDYLSKYADPEEEGLTKCTLFTDHADNSFSFTMDKRRKDGEYRYWFNGGLIYHDFEKDWSVHT